MFLWASALHCQSITYKSFATEYSKGIGGILPLEKLPREIIVSKDSISIVSHGRESTAIQRWKVNHINEVGDHATYHCHILNKDLEYPAIFTIVQFEGKVELIEYEGLGLEGGKNARFFIE